MPTVFSHALVGGSFGGASVASGTGPSRWVRVLLLACVAMAPDLDVIGLRLGIDYGHPLGHRGFTHSLFFAVAIGLASVPVWRLLGDDARTALRFGLLVGLACASHGVLDALTNGGLGVGFFIPFENGRYFLPWRPIRVSPLSVSAFLSPAGMAVLASELAFVGLPCAVGWAIVRRRRAAG